MTDKSQSLKTRRAARPQMHPDIRRLLVVPMLCVLIGAITTMVGELVLGNEKIKDIGFSITLLAAGFYFFLRFLGRLKARPATDPGASETPESGGTETADQDPDIGRKG